MYISNEDTILTAENGEFPENLDFETVVQLAADTWDAFFPYNDAQIPVSPVEIYVWPCDGLMTYAGFRVDLAAALEDAIVRDLMPPWNKRK